MIIAEGILLPVQIMFRRLNLQRITQDRGAAVRRGAEPDNVGRMSDRTVVAVEGLVMERDADRHGGSLGSRLGPGGYRS